MIAVDTLPAPPQPENRSAGAAALFVLIALVLPAGLLIYHLIL